MTYLTDGIHLYEIAAERAVKNYGVLGGIIRYVIIRDCLTEAVYKIDELHRSRLAPASQRRGVGFQGRVRAMGGTESGVATSERVKSPC